jgi:hypothetical protein
MKMKRGGDLLRKSAQICQFSILSPVTLLNSEEL